MLESYNGILYGGENEQTTATHNNMDKSHKYWVTEARHKMYSLNDLVI